MQPDEPNPCLEADLPPTSDLGGPMIACGMTQQIPNIWSFEYKWGLKFIMTPWFLPRTWPGLGPLAALDMGRVKFIIL